MNSRNAITSYAENNSSALLPLPTLPSLHVNEEKSAPAITPYTEKNTHQNDENDPDENTEKSHLKKNETTYAGRENKPPVSPKEILAV
ncbi:hypothetical protein NX188_004293 [Salmonella enterica]|nr:hypothetical protein [Salmonella enterica]